MALEVEHIFLMVMTYKAMPWIRESEKLLSRVQLFVTPWTTVHGITKSWTWPRDFSPSQNTGVGSRSLLQGTFPTQGSNPGPPHCRRILYQLSYQGSPRLLEWVAYPFSSISSWPRNPTNQNLLHCRWILYQLSYKGSPRTGQFKKAADVKLYHFKIFSLLRRYKSAFGYLMTFPAQTIVHDITLDADITTESFCYCFLFRSSKTCITF